MDTAGENFLHKNLKLAPLVNTCKIKNITYNKLICYLKNKEEDSLHPGYLKNCNANVKMKQKFCVQLFLS